MGFEQLADLKSAQIKERQTEYEQFQASHSRDQWDAFRIFQIVRTYGKAPFTATDLSGQTGIHRKDILPVLNRWRTAGALEIVGPDRQVYDNFNGAETKMKAVDLGLIQFEPMAKPKHGYGQSKVSERVKEMKKPVATRVRAWVAAYPEDKEFTSRMITDDLGVLHKHVSAAIIAEIRRGNVHKVRKEGPLFIYKRGRAPKPVAEEKTKHEVIRSKAPAPKVEPEAKHPANQFLIQARDAGWVVAHIAIRDRDMDRRRAVWVDYRGELVEFVGDEISINKLPKGE